MDSFETDQDGCIDQLTTDINSLVKFVQGNWYTLTKEAFLKEWSKMHAPDDKAITVTQFLTQIKTYPDGVVMTKKQRTRLVTLLNQLIGQSAGVTLNDAPAHAPHNISRHGRRKSYNYFERSLVPKPGLVDESQYLTDPYLKVSIMLILDGCEKMLTSSLNTVFQELLFNVEIYLSDTNQSFSSFIVIKDILEKHGWKFDGYEGFQREPNIREIRKSFENAMK